MDRDDIPSDLIEDIPFTGGKVSSSPFIKGPIPLWWVEIVTRECKPSALKLALLLFYRHGLKDHGRPITRKQMELFSVNRWRKTEGLDELAQAGLVTLAQRGRRLVPQLDLATRNPNKKSI
jgi:hypothetical protein